MGIYTRRGDHGQTSLADGSRVTKDSLRVEAYGAVDEANCAVGLARAAGTDPLLDALLLFVQQKLFNCSSSLATPPSARSDRTPVIVAEDIAALEVAIDGFSAAAPPLDRFVLASGTELAARLHVARTVTRRAERRVVSLHAEEPVDERVLGFLNRLSDTLFAAARAANAAANVAEDHWDAQADPPR